jgi:hypothetical protein
MKIALVEREKLKAYLRIEVRDRNGRLLDVPCDDKNFIVDLGLQRAIEILAGDLWIPARRIFRMALGDQGAVIGSPFTPKVPDATWPARTGLFHEVTRRDIGSFSHPTTKSARFSTTFNSSAVDVSSFSSLPNIVSEAALIIRDPTGAPFADTQINKAPPDVLDPSESMFSMRTFKSTPFDPADAVVLTAMWTVFIA